MKRRFSPVARRRGFLYDAIQLAQEQGYASAEDGEEGDEAMGIA